MSTTALPANSQAEEAVLGYLLLHPQDLPDVAAILGHDGSMFSEDLCRDVWLGMVEVAVKRREPLDIVALYDALLTQGRPVPYSTLGELTTALPWDNPGFDTLELGGESYMRNRVVTWARIVARTWELRQAVIACSEVAEYRGRSLPELIEIAKSTLGQSASLSGETLIDLSDVPDPEQGEAAIPCGLPWLDRHIKGWQPARLIILAARTAMGKTALALNFARTAALRNHPVLFVSLEMEPWELRQRLVLLNGKPLSGIQVDQSTKVTLARIEAVAQRFRASHTGLPLVVVDYLQLIQATPRRGQSRENEVAELSRGLKSLSRSLACPVMALSQRSRAAVQGNQDHADPLTTLRESGSIEQDADVILFLEPITASERKSLDRVPFDVLSETVGLRVGKHRQGPTGKFYVRFEKDRQRFTELDLHTDSRPDPGPVPTRQAVDDLFDDDDEVPF